MHPELSRVFYFILFFFCRLYSCSRPNPFEVKRERALEVLEKQKKAAFVRPKNFSSSLRRPLATYSKVKSGMYVPQGLGGPDKLLRMPVWAPLPSDINTFRRKLFSVNHFRLATPTIPFTL